MVKWGEALTWAMVRCVDLVVPEGEGGLPTLRSRVPKASKGVHRSLMTSRSRVPMASKRS